MRKWLMPRPEFEGPDCVSRYRHERDYGGLGGLGIRDDAAARPLYCKACGWYSAATSEAMAISKARVFCNDTISA